MKGEKDIDTSIAFFCEYDISLIIYHLLSLSILSFNFMQFTENNKQINDGHMSEATQPAP